MNIPAQQHWETIYTSKQPNEVSWTQDVPAPSLQFIHTFNLPKTAKIIDVGGGDSKLVDHLLNEGFEDITVLDISAAAIERAKIRLGDMANQVKWLVSDVLEFHPTESYDLWHDRAAFHFQTSTENIQAYLQVAEKAANGKMIVATFSTDGPTKCSGLVIKQYDETTMTNLFEQNGFQKLDCKREDHLTPFGNVQNFVFCSFQKKQILPTRTSWADCVRA
jgi:trans-aconitate methyltransferase